MWVNVYRLRGGVWKKLKRAKGCMLWAKTRLRRRRTSPPKWSTFYISCTILNKRQWQRTGSWKWECGSGPRQCHFYGHTNKVLLGESTSHTFGCTHAKNSLIGFRIYRQMDQHASWGFIFNSQLTCIHTNHMGNERKFEAWSMKGQSESRVESANQTPTQQWPLCALSLLVMPPFYLQVLVNLKHSRWLFQLHLSPLILCALIAENANLECDKWCRAVSDTFKPLASPCGSPAYLLQLQSNYPCWIATPIIMLDFGMHCFCLRLLAPHTAWFW